MTVLIAFWEFRDEMVGLGVASGLIDRIDIGLLSHAEADILRERGEKKARCPVRLSRFVSGANRDSSP